MNYLFLQISVQNSEMRYPQISVYNYKVSLPLLAFKITYLHEHPLYLRIATVDSGGRRHYEKNSDEYPRASTLVKARNRSPSAESRDLYASLLAGRMGKMRMENEADKDTEREEKRARKKEKEDERTAPPLRHRERAFSNNHDVKLGCVTQKKSFPRDTRTYLSNIGLKLMLLSVAIRYFYCSRLCIIFVFGGGAPSAFSFFRFPSRRGGRRLPRLILISMPRRGEHYDFSVAYLFMSRGYAY